MICRIHGTRYHHPRSRCGLMHVRRASFTLVELMVVVSIIGVLTSAVLVAMYGVMEQAKIARTKAQIAKLHEMIMVKWQSYNTRVLRVTSPPLPSGSTRRWPVIPEPFVDSNGNGKFDTGEPFLPPTVPNGDPNGNGVCDSGMARVRLDMLRDLMRMELPDRISDLAGSPVVFHVLGPSSAPWPGAMPAPALWQSYRRRADVAIKAKHGATASWTDPTKWTDRHRGAECLYLIISSIRVGDERGIDYFKESEIGDIDDDGMLEILDAWGHPIEFLRWPAGYASEVQPLDPNVAADSFDPHHVDTRATYRLIPLIYSAGPDRRYDILIDDPGGTTLFYNVTDPPNDPYTPSPGSSWIGTPGDWDMNGEINHTDNITNHLLDEA